jgi:rubrerythrin
MNEHWTLDDIDWRRFDPTKVDRDILAIVRAASMVEYNADDYVCYLCNVLPDDSEFAAAARQWGAEERQHGLALACWARMADPTFDFDGAFAAFVRGFRPNVEASHSIRGSRTGELLSRCMVEIGTSSFYSAIRDGTEEPVLKQICANIARDEFGHYSMFRRHMHRYLASEGINLWTRIKTLIARAFEAKDDELAYAFHAGNALPGPYDRERAIRAYGAKALRLYQPAHVERGVTLALKAAGIERDGWWQRSIAAITYRLLQLRAKRFARVAV